MTLIRCSTEELNLKASLMFLKQFLGSNLSQSLLSYRPENQYENQSEMFFQESM